MLTFDDPRYLAISRPGHGRWGRAPGCLANRSELFLRAAPLCTSDTSAWVTPGSSAPALLRFGGNEAEYQKSGQDADERGVREATAVPRSFYGVSHDLQRALRCDHERRAGRGKVTKLRQEQGSSHRSQPPE